MKAIHLAALAAVTLPPAGVAQARAASSPLKTLQWDQVSDADLGQTRIICGPVAAAMGPQDLAKTPGPGLIPTLGSLVLGGAPTDDLIALSKDHHRFKVVIQNYHEGFQSDPAPFYRGKNVCVAGPVVLALVGGYEMLPTHPSQIAVQGAGLPMIPRGDVRRLPKGAISYAAAKAHIGETRTVCGVVQSGWADMIPARMFPPGFTIPENIRRRLPANFKLSDDMRKTHELYVGDRVSFTVALLDSAAQGLPKPALDYYTGRDVCVTGLLKPSIMEGASMLVEDRRAIRILK